MQITYTLFLTDNRTITSQLIYAGQMTFLPPNQQRQSTEGIYIMHCVVLLGHCVKEAQHLTL